MKNSGSKGTRSLKAWSCLFAILCSAQAAAAGPPHFAARIDSIYLALGRGDSAAAAESSAALMEALPSNREQREEAMQARLDVLMQGGELDKAPGEQLQATIAAAQDMQALAGRFTIAQADGRNDSQAAFALAAAAKAKSRRDVVELQSLTAHVANSSGHLHEGAEQAEYALSAWRRQSGARARWHEVELYRILGHAQLVTGSNEDALRTLRMGSRAAVSTFGADAPARFKIDADMATALADLGRGRDALEVRESLFDAAQRRYGSNSVQAAKFEALVAASYTEIADYATSRKRYEHALSVLAALPDAPADDRGMIASNYGNLLQQLDELDASVMQYRSALQMFGDRPEKRHACAVVYANMGNSLLKLHRFEDAITSYRQALSLREAADGKDAPGLAYALEGMGSASLALHDGVEAEADYRRALALRERSVTPNHPSVGPLMFALAMVRWMQGDMDEAFRLAVQVAERQQAVLASFATDFSARQSVAFRDLLMPATALAVTLAARRGDDASIATAWRLAMAERGLVTRTEARRLATARAAQDPTVARALDAWRQANTALGDALFGNGADASAVATLTAEAESAERELWRVVGTKGDTTHAAIDLTELSKALPSDGVLLAYTEGMTDDMVRQAAVLDQPVAEDWYAFTLRASGKPQLRRVGGIAALSAQVHGWYADLRKPDSDSAQLRRDGLALRAVALASLPDTTTVGHLFVVPEGELYRMSFAALPEGSGGYLIEHTAVHTLTQEADLLASAPAESAGARALLAGDPDFPGAQTVRTVAADGKGAGTRSLCLRAAHEGFAAIPSTARELADIDALLSAHWTKGQVDLIRGREATRQSVLAALPKASVVHLATHGFSLDESCADVPDSRGVTLERASEMETQTEAISGLAFSGATIGPGSAPEGVISPGDLAALDLSRVDWIALSACDSGLGSIGRNEGVFGMRRALRLAGARTVIMSLWQINDATTADLMTALYRSRFVAHADVPGSMATAMRTVIGARRAAGLPDHPYYWAAFVGEGGWH